MENVCKDNGCVKLGPHITLSKIFHEFKVVPRSSVFEIYAPKRRFLFFYGMERICVVDYPNLWATKEHIEFIRERLELNKFECNLDLTRY